MQPHARTEIKEALNTFKKDLAQSIAEFNSIQKDNFFALLNKQSEQNTNTSTLLGDMRQTLENKIKEMQQSNEQKLEQMRITVDEKLQQTLEARLGESFKLVSERLEAVHKGLGDMQTLATGVGDLKTRTQQCKNTRRTRRVSTGKFTGTNTHTRAIQQKCKDQTRQQCTRGVCRKTARQNRQRKQRGMAAYRQQVSQRSI